MDERHPAVAQADVGHLHFGRHPVQDDPVLRPVELVGLARRKRQRHERLGRRYCRLALLPAPDVSPHRIVTALVTSSLQPFEDPQVVEPVTRRLAVVLLDQPLQILLECRQLRIGLNLPLVPGRSLS